MKKRSFNWPLLVALLVALVLLLPCALMALDGLAYVIVRHQLTAIDWNWSERVQMVVLAFFFGAFLMAISLENH